MLSPEVNLVKDTDEFKNELMNKLSKEDIMKILIEGIYNGSKSVINNNITLEKGMGEYEKLAEYKLSEKSVSCIKTVNRRFLSIIPGSRPLGSITKKVAEYVIMKLAETSKKGIKTYRNTIHAEFNVFLEWNYLEENPFSKIKLPKLQKGEIVVLNNEEQKMIISYLIEKGKNVIADMVEFSLNSGMRGGEVVNLRWGDVERNNRLIKVGSKNYKTKSRKIRIIPFNDCMEEIINNNIEWQNKSSKRKSEFVFAQNNGKPYRVDTVSKTFKKAVRDLGLPEELHWHCLRHTAASNWVNNKVPIYTVQKLLGHANVNTTQIYAKVNLQELRDAVNSN